MTPRTSVPIPAEIADIEISKYLELREPGRAILTAEFKDDSEKMNFHGSPHNSFIFERNDILRFFLEEADIPSTIPKGKAELLMVVFGAHPGVDAVPFEEFKQHEAQFPQGRPTVIVAGVNLDENETNTERQISLLNIAKPALEYPPGRTISKLHIEPGTDGKRLSFEFQY